MNDVFDGTSVGIERSLQQQVGSELSGSIPFVASVRLGDEEMVDAVEDDDHHAIVDIDDVDADGAIDMVSVRSLCCFV